IEVLDTIQERCKFDEKRLNKAIEPLGIKDITFEDVKKIKHYILENVTSAKYYIDNRDNGALVFVADAYKEAMKTDEKKAEDMIHDEIKAECTVYPEDKLTAVVVDVTFDKKCVSAKFERNETFRSVVKELGYKWSNEKMQWEKKIGETTGTAED
uniref:hypothetical protein n=1 Tax=Streptococcus sobrinus TaxID=1310 RepID=UPI0005B3300C